MDWGKNYELRPAQEFLLPADCEVDILCRQVAEWACKNVPEDYVHFEAAVPVDPSQVSLFHGDAELFSASRVTAAMRQQLVARIQQDDWQCLINSTENPDDRQLLVDLSSYKDVGDHEAFGQVVKLMVRILNSPRPAQRGAPVLRGRGSSSGEALFEFVRLLLLEKGMTAAMIQERLEEEFNDFLR